MLGGHWQSWSAFFNMGGYAATIWVSYALVLGSLVAVAWHSKRRYRRLVSALKKRLEKS